jgi:hypothetical protein
MRGIVIAFLLLFSLSAQGQFIIDSYRFAPTGPDLLLDSFPGAGVAFSFRKLAKGYNGNAIKVVRASDKDSVNVGFVNGYLDTISMKSFCGTSATDSCFVSTWYDQSGNTRNAVNYTYATMPKIMINGEVLYKGTNVVMQRDSDFVAMPANLQLTDQSIFSAMALNIAVNAATPEFAFFQADSTTVTNFLVFGSATGSISSERHSWLTLGTSSLVYGSGQTTTNLSAARYLWTHLFNFSSPTTEVYKNSALESMTIATGSGGGGAFSATNYPRSFNLARPAGNTAITNNSTMEVIVYPSYESSNRAAIETNINNFYLIY